VSEQAISPLSPAPPVAAGGRGAAVVRSGLLSMVGLIALGGTRLIHGSLVSRATDHATYAVVGTLIGLATTASLFLPGGVASAASKFIPFHRGKGDPAAARAAHRMLTVLGIACGVLLGALVGVFAAVALRITVANAVSVALLTAVFRYGGLAGAVRFLTG
jgi:Na+-driven multidrug efflux pump